MENFTTNHAPGGDLVASLEIIEFAKRIVDVGGGAEFLDVADEGGRRRGRPGRDPFGAEQRVWSRGRSLGQRWADGKSGAPRQSGAGNGAGRNR